MRTFVITTVVSITLAGGLTAASPTVHQSTASTAVASGSPHGIPWLCRIFGLCCER